MKEIKKGDQFQHLGGIFTIGHIYNDGLLYIKSPEGEISEMPLSEFKSRVRNGVYQMVSPDNSIKIIETGKATLLAVKVPEGAHNFHVFLDREPYLSVFITDIPMLTDRIYLPDGNWQIIALSTEITEEQATDLMPLDTGIVSGVCTNKESFDSLMQANQCYSVNPYPFPSTGDDEYYDDGGFLQECYNSDYVRWGKAEANTGNWIILRKL